MTEQEGWFPVGSLQMPDGSRSFRNHNPLNLRESPFQYKSRDGFAVFKNDLEGIEAGIWDIGQKARGLSVTGLTGLSTLKDLIDIWAPSSDGNDPNSYLTNVCLMTGFTPDMQLNALLE